MSTFRRATTPSTPTSYKPSGPALQNFLAFELPKLPDGPRMIGVALNDKGQIVGGGYLDDNGTVKASNQSDDGQRVEQPERDGNP